MGHVFVSYAREDREFARELNRRLRRSQITAWQDVQDLRGGVRWQDSIDSALRSASALIVVLSPQSTRSQYVTYEWAIALAAGVPIVPIVRRHTDLHPKLAALQYVDFTKRKAWVLLWQALFKFTRPKRIRPTLLARFDLDEGKPQKIGGGYVVRVSVKRAPRNTERVIYEIYDETHQLLRLSSRNADTDHEVAFTTDGDVLVKATIQAGAKMLSIEAPLFDALRRKHRRTTSPPVRAALAHIRKN